MSSPNPSRRERASKAYERVKTEPGLARNTVMVGALIVIAAVVGAIILANQRFIPPWQSRLEFYAAFPAAPGISPGNGQEVRLAGVNVGDIVDAQVDSHGQAVLRMSLEQGHHVYENARLVLRPKSPLNEMYVTIDPGGPPSREIPQNYEFPQSSTVRPVQPDEVLDHLDDNAQRALTSLLSEADVALTNAKTQLPPGLDALRTVGNDLRPVSEQLVARKEKIRTLVSALGQISQALGGDDKRVAALANGLQVTLRSVAGHEPQVDTTLATLPGLVSNLHRSSDAIQGLSDQLDPTLRDLQRASDDLPAALKRLSKTSDRIDDVVDAARPFLDVARPVVADLRPFAGELQKALPELHGATRELDPLTNALVPYLPDAAAFGINSRSIVSAEDANGGILRGVLPVNADSLPGVFGPKNGIKPIPAPLLDKGTTGVQKVVPVLPGAQPAIPQDGSLNHTKPEPASGGAKGNPRRLVPAPGGDDAPRPRKYSDNNNGLGGVLPLGNK
jgi:phospholipid/cholesterol/gamma-HCH transport system substrate-binding protein